MGSSELTGDMAALLSYRFQVHGRVQKGEPATNCMHLLHADSFLPVCLATPSPVPLCPVFFRKHTHEIAQSLGLVGWVMNTELGTVVGEVEGPLSKMAELKHWLSNVGSPNSSITKAEFSNERSVDACRYKSFEVRR